MSVAVIVELPRPKRITLDQWKSLVARDAELRLREDPYLAENPSTGQKLEIPCGDGDAEILVEDEWLPFLQFGRGRLQTEYNPEFEDQTNPIRRKIVQVAKDLNATIGTDAGDEPLNW